MTKVVASKQVAGAETPKFANLGREPITGALNPSKKREYRVTNRLQEGKRPLYAVVFNFIDSRYFNVFATVGGNRVLFLLLSIQFFHNIFSLHS